MGKRKQSSELKTVPIPLQVNRYKDLHNIRTQASTHWNVDHVQPFFPCLETMFKTEHLENVREHGIKLNDSIQTILNKDTVLTSNGYTKNIHIKQSILINSLKWMRGDYGGAIGLPTTQEDAEIIKKKLQSPHNAAYVGSLFASVLSQSDCIHFPKVYGVYSGIAKKHTFDISDDYEELMDKPWFSQNVGKTFELRLADHVETAMSHSRGARLSLRIEDEVGNLEDVLEIDGIVPENEHMPEMNPVFTDDTDELGDDSSVSTSVSTSYLFEIQSCDCDMSDSMEIDEEEDEGYAWATVSNVPVQLTVMERCEGTLYQLMCLEPESIKHAAWLTQVLFALTYAQRMIGFTHNDLHSNNIMYTNTDQEFLWYKLDNKTYKVPTYGYVMKIIDFERGVGSIRVAGMKHPKQFVSDHFCPDEEAGGQYNIEPFLVSKHERIKPNPSFDLVRLATSLFWDLFPDGPDHEEYKSNPIFITLIRWMTLEDGSSILFGKKDSYHDRYHGFHLYKAIARLCKDTAVPRKEILKLNDLYCVTCPPMQQMDIIISS